MKKVNHIVWRYQKEENWAEIGGRLGIIIEDVVENTIENEKNVKLQHVLIQMDYIFGPAPPAELLYELLRVLDLADFKPELETQPYLIERREKTSGACSYLKKVLKDKKYMDTPITANLHVSMYDKLNSGFWNYANDLLLFIDEFPEIFGKNLEFYNLELKVIEEEELYQIDDFVYPQHDE